MAPSLTNDTTGAVTGGARLGAATRLGPVHLTVTDLERSVSFYERIIGLRTAEGDDGQGFDGPVARLHAGGEAVLVLHEDPDAQPAGRHSGLYHVALLYPSRVELARAGLRVAASAVPIDGASDHGTHEAIYLPDPDGIGLELAADRPRSAWPDMTSPEAYAGGPQPLNQRALFGLVAGEEPTVPALDGVTVGHVHLHVGDVVAGMGFYRDVLGFDLVTALPSVEAPVAAFVSAGGYHHHVAFNSWRGESVPPAPRDGVVGMREWTLVVADDAELAGVRARLDAAAAVGGTVVVDVAADGSSFVARDPFGMVVRVLVEVPVRVEGAR